MRQTKNNLVGGNLFQFADQREVQAFTSKAVLRKGFNFNIAVGSQTFPVLLSGQARHLIGVMVYDSSGDPANFISLTVNNLKLIDQVSQAHLCRVFGVPAAGNTQSNPLQQEVVPLNQPLGGNDAIAVDVQAAASGNLYVVFLYQNESAEQ